MSILDKFVKSDDNLKITVNELLLNRTFKNFDQSLQLRSNTSVLSLLSGVKGIIKGDLEKVIISKNNGLLVVRWKNEQGIMNDDTLTICCSEIQARNADIGYAEIKVEFTGNPIYSGRAFRLDRFTKKGHSFIYPDYKCSDRNCGYILKNKRDIDPAICPVCGNKMLRVW